MFRAAVVSTPGLPDQSSQADKRLVELMETIFCVQIKIM